MGAVARAQSWLFDLFAHNHAEQLRTARAVARKAHGLALEDLPYPGAAVGSGNTVNHSAGGVVKGALLSAALLAGGAGAGLYLGQGTPPPHAAPVAAPAPSSAPAKAPGPFFIEWNWQADKDGKASFGQPKVTPAGP